MGGVSTAPSLRRQRRNGGAVCSMPSPVLAESGSLLVVAVERWHVEPRVMGAIQDHGVVRVPGLGLISGYGVVPPARASLDRISFRCAPRESWTTTTPV